MTTPYGSVLIRFSGDDIAAIERETEHRQGRAKRLGRKPRYGAPVDARSGVAMDYAYTGCAGECAVAIMFGIPWEPTPGLDEDEGDVAGWWVRATQHETGRLLVHGNEPDTRPFCLVTVDMPWACVRGWLYGYEVKQDRYWVEPQKGRPCYLAPQRRLSPVAQMKPWPKQLGDMPWGRWED